MMFFATTSTTIHLKTNLFPGIYNVSVTADWCHYARHVLCSIASHSPALDHHFVNSLRAPWRGWLDITSFVLECLSKLQEEDRCYNSLFDTPWSSCALMCTASNHPKIQCACILLPSRLCKGYSDQFCHRRCRRRHKLQQISTSRHLRYF